MKVKYSTKLKTGILIWCTEKSRKFRFKLIQLSSRGCLLFICRKILQFSYFIPFNYRSKAQSQTFRGTILDKFKQNGHLSQFDTLKMSIFYFFRLKVRKSTENLPYT